MRKLTALLLFPFMKITGFRFSKEYRWETTKFHAFVYATVDTVGANWRCDSKKFVEMLEHINTSN